MIHAKTSKPCWKETTAGMIKFEIKLIVSNKISPLHENRTAECFPNFQKNLPQRILNTPVQIYHLLIDNFWILRTMDFYTR